MNIIQAKQHYTDKECEEKFAATLLLDDTYDLVVRDTCTVLKPDGSPLLIFLKGVVPLDHCKAAYSNLKDSAVEGGASNRGMAGGKGRIVGGNAGVASGVRVRVRKYDGSISSTNNALMSNDTKRAIKKWGGKVEFQQSDGSFKEIEPRTIPSGIVGFIDGNPRFPYCRLTAFNINHPEKFKAALPFIKSVDRAFQQHIPDRYANQQEIVKQTSPDFFISGTAFTTITVNLNFQTAVHKDAGDLKAGFGVMSALRAGKFEGCYTCFPGFRVAADMRTGDVLLADVHEWHGNTPLHAEGKYERLSMIFYYREGIKECGSHTEELQKAKATKGLTHLKDWK